MTNERYQQNSHKWQTWDLRWQLGFQWHRRGIELVSQVPRLFHSATVSQCDHFLLLHMYMYLLFETSPSWLPGWRGFFFKLNLVGGTPGGALSSNVFTICAVYWSLGCWGYFGVSNVVLVYQSSPWSPVHRRSTAHCLPSTTCCINGLNAVTQKRLDGLF